ncbi:MAG: D-tyrosyl-tRNA(Tyr) deacylase [Neisseriaceae bacterium]|nr:D-tyrosyl-tRNA(Tyr) deacylase [Neisseriaceae bacterium]MBP6863520.1 D-tyrosyl-tRNA(Tyr) deacylase [Neisseriaceae bacterium]
MRILLQRAQSASVTVEAQTIAQIGPGMLLLVGVGPEDNEDDVAYLVKKISKLRIFDDENGIMNRSLLDTGLEALAVSQFTLFAQTHKGNRPSYAHAAPPEVGLHWFNVFVHELAQALGKPVPTGEFGADMQVALVNDGPVTLWLDSQAR